jgi:hypothetical protein
MGSAAGGPRVVGGDQYERATGGEADGEIKDGRWALGEE